MPTKPRLTYLHQYFVPPNGSGGTRSYEFAKRLVDHGYDVTVITSNSSLPKPYNECNETQEIYIDGIRVIAIPQPYSNKVSYRDRMVAFAKFAARASLYSFRQPSDLIFATSTPLTIIIPALACKLRNQAPMVFEVRDLWPELPIAMGALKNPLLKASAKAMEWVAYHSARHVVALSPGMAEGVVNRGIDPEQVTVISNSSDLSLFEQSGKDISWVRSRLGISKDQRLIVYTGTLGPINGVEYLAKLAAQLKAMGSDAHLLVVGDGMQRDKIKSTAQELGVLGKNFSMWDPLPKYKLRDVVCAADLATSLFIPLKEMEHNSANKFFDALAAGKPIAINYGGWQKDIIEKHGAGLCLPAHDLKAAAVQLTDFLKDELRMQRAASASKTLARQEFHRDLLFSKLHRVFQSALGTNLENEQQNTDHQLNQGAVS